jgi:putative holliday junction resolvase
MRCLGLDLGSKTLGLAISDVSGLIATSLKTINYSNEDYNTLTNELAAIITDRSIEKLILGFPKNMNNSIGPRAEKTLEFKKILEDKLNIEVILQDERLTTKLANNMLISADMSRNKRKQVVDKLAASYILQSYLDSMKGNK